jgi:hypothetical protein
MPLWVVKSKWKKFAEVCRPLDGEKGRDPPSDQSKGSRLAHPHPGLTAAGTHLCLGDCRAFGRWMRLKDGEMAAGAYPDSHMYGRIAANHTASVTGP